LAQQGITPEQLRASINVVLGEPRDDIPTHIPYTPPAKKALELAVREALRLGHNYNRYRTPAARPDVRGQRRLEGPHRPRLLQDLAEHWVLAELEEMARTC